MADIAASVLTRLKNKAQASGRTDDFSTVLRTIKEFLTEPFIAAVKDEEFEEKWTALESKWK